MLYRFPALFYRTEDSPCTPTGDGIKLSEGDIHGLRLLYGYRPEDTDAFEARTRDLAEAIVTAYPEVQLEAAVTEGFEQTAMQRVKRHVGD